MLRSLLFAPGDSEKKLTKPSDQAPMQSFSIWKIRFPKRENPKAEKSWLTF